MRVFHNLLLHILKGSVFLVEALKKKMKYLKLEIVQTFSIILKSHKSLILTNLFIPGQIWQVSPSSRRPCAPQNWPGEGRSAEPTKQHVREQREEHSTGQCVIERSP